MATRVEVHGHVQGVFFRDSTQELAREHGVRGWVRNDPEGTVTAHLEGEPGDVEEVLSWMRNGGPPRARVDDVRTTELEDEDIGDFRVVH
jgi:acylphosphatase